MSSARATPLKSTKAYAYLLSILVFIAVFLFQSTLAQALTPEERRRYAERGIYFIDGPCPDGSVPAGSVDGPGYPSAAAGCVCTFGAALSKDARYRATWGFLTGPKGLSEEATAGIMGNLEAESGIDPHNMQNNAPLPDSPELPTELDPSGNPIPHSAISGKFGYGLAQWAATDRQQDLINYAKETGRPTGDMGLQLDFLWKVLNEKYPGILSTLQTQGVSLEDASNSFFSEFKDPQSFAGRTTDEQGPAEAARRLTGAQAIYDEFSGQSIPSTTGAGCNAYAINVNLISEDTSSIPCASNTADAGVSDGYRDGQLVKLRLCRVSGGALVNSQLAGSVQQMLDHSAAAGVNLSINGGFRSMEGQISVYNRWCAQGGKTPTPPPYPRPEEEYTRCPGAAPPGYSNHQQGLALDLECDNALIPMRYSDASNNACFRWLQANAIRYGLYEFGKGEDRGSRGYEGWHWSVDGG